MFPHEFSLVLEEDLVVVEKVEWNQEIIEKVVGILGRP